MWSRILMALLFAVQPQSFVLYYYYSKYQLIGEFTYFPVHSINLLTALLTYLAVVEVGPLL